MKDNYDYGKCKFCGANMVRNPKTGKVFCGDKCWLKNQQDNRQFNPRPNAVEKFMDEDKKWADIRAEKREGMAWGNAKFCAAELLAAAIRKGELNLPDAVQQFQDLAEQIYFYEPPNGR